MEGDVDGQERNGEHRLALGERNLALVKAARSTNLPEVGDKTVKSARRSCYYVDTRSVVERNLKLRVLR